MALVNWNVTRKHSSRISSDRYQMSLAGGPQVWCPGGGGYSILLFGKGGVPYHVTYPMMHLMLPTPPHWQTDSCENITFPQLRLQAVIIVRHNSLLIFYHSISFQNVIERTDTLKNLTLRSNCDTPGVDTTKCDTSGVSQITNTMTNSIIRNDSRPTQEDQKTLKSDHPGATNYTNNHHRANHQNTDPHSQQLSTGAGHQEKQKQRNHGRQVQQQQHQQQQGQGSWCS